jgi:hypothetical protein
MSDTFTNDQMKAELEEMLDGQDDDKSLEKEPPETEVVKEGEEEETIKVVEGEEKELEEAAVIVDDDLDKSGELEVELKPEETIIPEVVTHDFAEQMAELKKQNELLMEQINNLATPKEEVVAEETLIPTDDGKIPDFVGELDLDMLSVDKDIMNTMLNGVVNNAVNRAVEKMLVNIPGVVSTQVKQQKRLTDAVDDFYGENEDLIPAKKVVAMNTNEVVAEHPDWTLEKVLEEAAVKTRKMLGKVKETTGKTEETNVSGRKPALPKRTSAKAKETKPSMSKLQQELAELM